VEAKIKNSQSSETLKNMVRRAFNGAQAANIEELTEGTFNAAYLVVLPDGREAVLKIAPAAGVPVATCEKGILRTEVDCLRLVAEQTDVPVPEVLFYDDSHTVCDSDYFFMSKLGGKSLNLIAKELSEMERDEIDRTLGRYNAEINVITGTKFGYYGRPEKQGDHWFDVFSSIVRDTLNDAKAMKIDIGVPYETIEPLLEDSRSCFEDKFLPRLVHWDLWAGNVFIKDREITGLIDFERCLWADPLMEVGFRSWNQSKSFLAGYGAGEFTEKQKKRIVWYDLYLFLQNSLETDYRKYPNDDMLIWAREKIRETVAKLQHLMCF
jgi:aminoglycoside phosphotransferase (APT) family kinase protein